MAQKDQDSKKPFRVIIVGGGLAGLSISHSLQLANIDHVVLEKHSEIQSIHGAALTIFPGVCRIFDQFGILKKIQGDLTPVTREFQHWPDGSVLAHASGVEKLHKSFDMPVLLFDRQKCIRYLYENLPDKSVIRTSTCVDRIEHTQTGVKVFLKDGTLEEGDIVIGADGVHSRVRQIMWDYAAENDPEAIPASDKTCLFTEFKGIFGVSNQKDMPDLGPSDVHVVMGNDVTKLLFTQPGIAYWGIIYKDEYSRPPARFKADEKTKEAIAHRFKDEKFTENLTFGALYKEQTRSAVLNIEEGILEKWHAGRIVLVGDSAHKMTADIGIGANMAIESAVVICNGIQRALASDPNHHPSPSEITAIFQEYQTKRYERAKIFVNLSGQVTRMRSYQSLWSRFFITRIAPISVLENMRIKRFIASFAKAPKLEYVNTRTINEEAEGWQKPKEGGSTKGAWFVYAIITSAVGIGLSYAAMLKLGLPVLTNGSINAYLTSNSA